LNERREEVSEERRRQTGDDGDLVVQTTLSSDVEDREKRGESNQSNQQRTRNLLRSRKKSEGKGSKLAQGQAGGVRSKEATHQ
jgi:hypothetical protein